MKNKKMKLSKQKLIRKGKSLLSTLLVLSILLTTFCCFDIGSLISSALVSRDTQTLTNASAQTSYYSTYNLNIAEMIYMAPSSNTTRYFMNNNNDGSVVRGYSTQGTFYFKCRTSESVSIHAQLLNSNLQVPSDGNYVASVSLLDGKSASGGNSDGLTIGTYASGSFNTKISSITLRDGGSSTNTNQKEYVIKWTITYVCGGVSYNTYAYSGVYYPNVSAASMATRDRRLRDGWDNVYSVAMTFLAGAHKYGGGNRSLNTSSISPLVSLPNYRSDDFNTIVANTYPVQANGGSFVQENYYEYNQIANCDSVSDNNVRSYRTWNYPGDWGTVDWSSYGGWSGYGDYNNPQPDQTKKTTIFFGNAYGGALNKRLSSENYHTNTYNYTTGVAYILVDSSRFTDYSQIPYLGAGFVNPYAVNDGNLLEIGSISIDPRSDYFTGEITCDAVNSSAYKGGTTKGMYALGGTVTAGFHVIGYNWKIITAGLTENNILKVMHTVGLHTTTVNRGTLRELYYKYLNSGVNSADTENWSNINSKVQEIVKKLCTTTGQDVTLSFSAVNLENLLSASKRALQKKMVAETQGASSSSPVVLLAPEVIYCYPDGESLNVSTTTPFQYFVENNVDVDNIYESASPKESATGTGHLYFATANAKPGTVFLSYKWLDRDYNTVLTDSTSNESGYIKFDGDTDAVYSSLTDHYNNKTLTLDSTNNVTSYTINGISSRCPSLATDKSGCVIEWQVKFTDKIDGYEKIITAYTYVYKPYVQPLVCATDVDYSDRYASSLAWISGFHYMNEATSVTLTEDDGDASDRYYEMRYPIFTGDSGASAFLSASNQAYVGGNSTVSGSQHRTNIGTITYGTGASEYYALFTGTNLQSGASQHIRFNAQPNNKCPGDYGSKTYDSSSTFPQRSLCYVGCSGKDYNVVKNYNPASGVIYIDTSRYTNLSQIPNLGVGLTVTSDASSDGNSGGWYVANYTGRDTSGSASRRNGFDTGRYKSNTGSWSTVFYDYGEIIASQISAGQDDKFSFNETEGIRYAGAWPEDIREENFTQTYSVKMLYTNWDKITSSSSRQGMGSSVMDLQAVHINKQKLREALNNAIKNVSALGMCENLDSYFFAGSTYEAYKTYYHDAYAVLTLLDGYYGSYYSQAQIDTLADNLIDTTAKLVGGADHNGVEQTGGTDILPLNVKQVNIGITSLKDGGFELENLGSHELSATTRDSVYFTKDTFEGYNYKGAVRFNSYINIPDGTVLSTNPTFMSSTQYSKYQPTISGGNLTLTRVDQGLKQYRDNHGVVVADSTDANYGDVTYNWCTQQDGDMYLYYFYEKEQYTTYFDLNYNNASGNPVPVNVAPVGEYSTANNKIYSFLTKTTNGVTVTYDFETDVFTLNGVLTDGTGTFFSSLMSHLTNGTYTDCLYYIGGTASKTSGKHLTISGNYCAPGTNSRSIWKDYFPAGNQSSAASNYLPNGIINSATTYSYDGSLDHINFWSWCETTPTAGNGLVYTFDHFQLRYEKVSGSTASSIFSPNARILFYGQQYSSMPRPVREDYEFLGWYTEQEEGVRVDSASYVPEGDRTLYAHWRPRDRELRLDNDFDFNAWTECMCGDSADMTYLKNSAVNTTASITSDAYGDAMLVCRSTTDGYIRTPNLTFDGTNTTVYLNLTIIDLVPTAVDYGLYIKVLTSSGTEIASEVKDDTTPGYVTVAINIHSTDMAANTQYYVKIGSTNTKLTQYEITQFSVANEKNTTMFSSDRSIVSNAGTTIVDKGSQTIMMTANSDSTDTFTNTYGWANSYKFKLKTGVKYTFSFDYNVVNTTSASVYPFIFYFPNTTTVNIDGSKMIYPGKTLSGTGSYSCEFTLPENYPYAELRFGVKTPGATVSFWNIVVQETFIFEQNTDMVTAPAYSSKNKLGGLTTTTESNVNAGYATVPVKVMSATMDDILSDENYWEKFNVRYSRVGVGYNFDGLEVPVRNGYYFVGWFTEPGGGTQVTDEYGNAVSNVKVTDDMVLYSQWIKAIYQLLYENEFPFEKWNKAVPVTVNAAGTETRNMFDNTFTLTGHGTINHPYTGTYTMTLISGHKYEFTCDVENVSTSAGTQYWALPKAGINYGSGMTYPQAAKFVKSNGTDTTSKISTTFTMVGSTLTIFFYHSAYGDGNQSWGYDGVAGMLNSASIMYSNISIRDLTDPCNIQSTDGYDTILTTYYKDVIYSETFGELPSTKSSDNAANNIARPGYTFKGWFANQNAQGNGYGTQYTSESIVPYSDIQMFAQWELNNPTISLNLNGTTKNTASLGAFTYYTSSLNTSTGDITKDTAVNVEASTSNTNAVTTTITPYYSSTVTLPIPTMVGYTFVGWNANTTPDKAVLTNNLENSPSTYKVGNGNATLTAAWAVNDYTISYVMNNGTNDSTNVDVADGTTKACQFDTAVKVTKPTKTGWVFEGWTLSTDTAGYTTACYYTTDANSTTAITNSTTKFGKNDDSIYVLNLTPTKDYTVTLTAHWSKVITANFYVVNSGTLAITNEKQQLTIYDSATSTDVTVANPANFTRNSTTYNFAGWRTDTTSEFPTIAKPATSYTTTLNATTDTNTEYNFYALYNNPTPVYFHYYNGTSHVKVSTSLYLIAYKSGQPLYNFNLYSADGVKYSNTNAQEPNITPNLDDKYLMTPDADYDGGTFKEWANNTTVNSTYGVSPSSSDINHYAIYQKDVSLSYNLNDTTENPATVETAIPSPQTKTAFYISKDAAVGTYNNNFTVTSEEPEREHCLFLGWSTNQNAVAPEYVGGQNIVLTGSSKIADSILYAIYLVTFDADINKNSELPKQKITVEKGYNADGTKMAPEETLKYDEDYIDAYNEAVSEYNTAYNNFVAGRQNSSTTANALLDLINIIKAKDSKLSTAVTNLSNNLKPLQSEYFNNFYALDGNRHSVADMNLNHYATSVLNTIKSAKAAGEAMIANKSLTIENQADLNSKVLAMAEGYKTRSTVETSKPIYNVSETTEAVRTALESSEDIYGVNYVYSGKGNYTYYCYTNNPNPEIVLDVNEADVSGSVITSANITTTNTSYPTVATASAPASNGGASGEVLLQSTYIGTNLYGTYLSNNMGTSTSITFQDGVNNANVTYSYDSANAENNYYNRKSQVVLCADFTSAKDKSTVAYSVKAHDDVYGGGNVATKSALSNSEVKDIPVATAGTDGQSITIIIDYHNTENLKAEGMSYNGDKFLNQYHLIRSAGGASNWELPAKGDTVYTVDDETFGQTGYGSFTYTFAGSSGITTVNQAITNLNLNPTKFAAMYKNYNDYNTAYNNLYNAAFAYAKSKDPTLTNMVFKNTFNSELNKYLSNKYYPDFYSANASGCIAAYNTMLEKQAINSVFVGTNITVGEGVTGNGLGFIPWGTNYSFNYYPASEAYTYVHLVDRWGNIYDGIVKTPKLDANSPKLSSISSNEISILEYGGSGIDTMSLSGATISFITDENSSFSGNEFKTTGNEVKLSTGVPNKTYQLTVTDSATNKSDLSVTSDENGIIILTVDDKEFNFDGAYTFTLNGVTVNLYDGVTNTSVISASVEDIPSINTNAVVDVKVSGSPDMVKLVDKDDPTNAIVVERADAAIEKTDGSEIWQVLVYVDKTSSTYYVSARYGDSDSSNYVELVITAKDAPDLTIHSMVVSGMVAGDGKTPKDNNGRMLVGRHDVTITTSTDVMKIQFVDVNGNTWTYDARTEGLTTDSDGERTWNIKLNFYTYGDWRLTIRTRSDLSSFASGVYEDLHATVI